MQSTRPPKPNLKIGGLNHLAIQIEDLDEAVTTLHVKASKLSHRQKMFPTMEETAFFIHDNERMFG